MFDIKNENTFLGGQNVHNLIIIGLLIYIIFKLIKKSEESGLMESLGNGASHSRGGVLKNKIRSSNPINFDKKDDILMGTNLSGLSSSRKLKLTGSKPSLSGCLGGLVNCTQNTNPNSGSSYGEWQQDNQGTACCKEVSDTK